MGFQDKPQKIKEFMEKHDIRSSVGYDARDKVSKKYGVRYGAGLIMINREGIVKRRVPKGFSEKTLLEGLAQIVTPPLVEKKSNAPRRPPAEGRQAQDRSEP